MGLGERLELLLEVRGVQKKDIAENIHVAPNTITGYLRNKRHPDYNTLVRLASYLGTTTDYLLGMTPHEAEGDSLTAEEELLVDMYRFMNSNGKEMFMDMAQTVWKHNKIENGDIKESL